MMHLCFERKGGVLGLCKEAGGASHVCYRSSAGCYKGATFLFFPEKNKLRVNLVYYRRIYQGGLETRWTSFRRVFEDHRGCQCIDSLTAEIS